jgi:hypothetical protein
MTNINQKIVTIMKEAQAIGKNGRNDRQHYDYVQAADVIREVRGLLVAQGLRLKSEVIGIERQPCGKQTLATLSIKYSLIDAETGEADVTTVIAEGADTGDKAINKAMTSGLKYYFRDMFLLDFADDAEAINSETTQGQKQHQKRRSLDIGQFHFEENRHHDMPLSMINENSHETPTHMTKEQLSANMLAAVEPIEETERKKRMREFFAKCTERKISDKVSKVIVSFYTGKESRKDVTATEWKDIITALPTLDRETILAMANSLKQKEAV